MNDKNHSRRPLLNIALTGSLMLGVAFVAGAGCTAEVGSGDFESVDEASITFEEFKAMAYQEPWENGVWIYNGDTPVETERELERIYLDYVQQGGLIVHQSGGVDAKWSDSQKTNITYCVSSSSFGSNYNTVVNAMNSATAAWEAAANNAINFVHLSAQDSNCTASNNNVIFDVRQVSGQSYLARAFFPNQSRSTRNVLIDTSSFGSISPWTLTGILRHELGHTLGFRHEHTRPEAGTCFEDNNWRALTTYDSSSVMHYPQCNGSQTGDLVLTQKDKDGIKALYSGGGGGTCAHDKCSTGVALNAANCGSVVAAVCAADSYCCNNSWDSICVGEVASIGNSLTCAGSCAHAPCTTGVALSSSCNSSVASICAADSYCCNNAWDSICVGEVASIAGKNCN